MKDDESRKLILARRAKFVAAAALGIIACDPSSDSQRPLVCLSQVMPHNEDASSTDDTTPQVADAGASVNDVPPQPCLSVALPPSATAPPPQVCLSPLPPPPPPDAGAPKPDAGAAKKPTAVKDAGPPPMPCLSPPFDG